MEYTEVEWIFDYEIMVIRAKPPKVEAICQILYQKTLEETQANGDLIAAAPNTYEGLKDALGEICRLCVRLNPQHEDCTSCQDMEERRKALSKADGA